MATLFGDMETRLIGDKRFFEKRHIEKFGKEYRDAQLVEKSIYVLEYLAQLRSHGLNPLFRGGSATQLLLPKPFRRLSIDLDIAVSDTDRLVRVMEKIKSSFSGRFFSFSRDRRKGIHFRIETPTYYTPGLSGFIILDVAEKEPGYKTARIELSTEFYKCGIKVRVPTVDSMLGDKLTTIGINTIGLLKNRPSMEYSKQLYDIILLMDNMRNFRHVFEAYRKCYAAQLEYRKKKYSFRKVLDDLAYTSRLFVVRTRDLPAGKIRDDAEYVQDGIIRINSHLARGLRFTRLNARTGGARLMFASRIMEMFSAGNITAPSASKALKNTDRIDELVRDREFIESIIPEIRKKEKFLDPRELKGNAPAALVYVYGYWYPDKFLKVF